MPIRVKCEQCKKTLSVKDHLAGKKIKCPVCQAPVVVGAVSPAGAAESSSPNPAAPKATAPTATKKPAVLGKPVSVTKSTSDRSKTNGAPDPTKNGTPAPPETVERPPEHAEAEALAAFAEELAPKVEEGPPKTIDFTCEWCEQELHLPLDQGGKQFQCTNPECKRIIKVPMPKIEAKKDWRKMDQKGPAAAMINQPQQLEDAWGTQNATKARQDSLAKAGALEAPPKPKRDATAWLFLGVRLIAGLAILVGLVFGVWTLINTKKQHSDLHDLDDLVKDVANPKIANPLLRAEAKRVLARLYLREIKGAFKSQTSILGADVVIDENAPAVNEQLFLIAKALALVEQGGEGEEADVLHIRRDWGAVSADLANALGKIRDDELKAVAVREVVTRLIQKKKEALAVQLAGGLAMSQKIALSVMNDEQEAIEEFAQGQPPLNGQIGDANVRSGFAEGYARKGEFDKAAQVALAEGEAKDRVEACLGVASIALAANKKDEASNCVKEGLKIAENANDLTEWNLLELIKLTARTEDVETAKKLAEKFQKPEFKTRALLEIFLAKCEKATGKIDAAELAELEDSAKDDYVPLALGWEALARHNAKMGASRGDNRKMFDARMNESNVPKEIWEHLRQMVDVGTYLGSIK
jgi:hypothetical protein